MKKNITLIAFLMIASCASKKIIKARDNKMCVQASKALLIFDLPEKKKKKRYDYDFRSKHLSWIEGDWINKKKFQFLQKTGLSLRAANEEEESEIEYNFSLLLDETVKYHLFFCNFNSYLMPKKETNLFSKRGQGTKPAMFVFEDEETKYILGEIKQSDYRKWEKGIISLRKSKALPKPFKINTHTKLNGIIKGKISFRYPKTKGMTKMEAKKARKEFLQKAIGKTLLAVYNFPKVYDKFIHFSNKNLPVPMTEEQIYPALEKIEKTLAKYFLNENYSYNNNILRPLSDLKIDNTILFSPGHTRGELSDKDALLNGLIKNKANRDRIFGILLVSETKIKVKRKNKKNIIIFVKINVKSVLRKYKFEKISEYIE